MKHCDNYKELIALYYYGETGAEESAQVLAHMGSCASCRAYMDELRQALPLITPEVPTQAESRRATARVMERVVKPARLSNWKLFPAFAAALGLVLLASVGYMNRDLFLTGKPAPTAQVAAIRQPAPVGHKTAVPQVQVAARDHTVDVRNGAPPAPKLDKAQKDMELAQNMDVLTDLDVLEDLDTLDEMENL